MENSQAQCKELRLLPGSLRGGVIKGKWPVLGSLGAQGSWQLGGGWVFIKERHPGRPAEGTILPGTVVITRELWHLESKQTDSKAESVRTRRGSSACWPGSNFQAEHFDCGKLWVGSCWGVSSGEGRMPTVPRASCHHWRLQGYSGSSGQSVKWLQGCPGQEQNELLLLHFLILFKAVTIDRKCQAAPSSPMF